jgi:uncharacterized membrane protein
LFCERNCRRRNSARPVSSDRFQPDVRKRRHTGATQTFGRSINAQGDIVGFYTVPPTTRGFLRTLDGAISTIDAPGAIQTQALGNNSLHEIAGAYRQPADPPSQFHAFLLRLGQFISFDLPGACSSGARQISEAGEIVGFYTDCSGLNHGYLLARHGSFTAIDFPGAVQTQALAINPGGEIVGNYRDATGEFHGFYRAREGVMTGLDVPFLGGHGTQARGINPQGDIVGSWLDGTQGNRNRGFLLRNGVYTIIDFPGAVHTVPWAISSVGASTGQYSLSIVPFGTATCKHPDASWILNLVRAFDDRERSADACAVVGSSGLEMR